MNCPATNHLSNCLRGAFIFLCTLLIVILIAACVAGKLVNSAAVTLSVLDAPLVPVAYAFFCSYMYVSTLRVHCCALESAEERKKIEKEVLNFGSQIGGVNAIIRPDKLLTIIAKHEKARASTTDDSDDGGNS